MWHLSDLVDMYRRDRSRFEYEMYRVRVQDESLYNHVMMEIGHPHHHIRPEIRAAPVYCDGGLTSQKIPKPKQTIDKNLLLLLLEDI